MDKIWYRNPSKSADDRRTKIQHFKQLHTQHTNTIHVYTTESLRPQWWNHTQDTGRLTLWFKQSWKWLVTFNPAKTESMLISKKVNKPDTPPLFMQNQQISEVPEHKHLGVILSNDCSWSAHIKYVTEKAWKRINVIRSLKFTLNRRSLETIYLSFIRPLLEYGDVIFDNLTNFKQN